MASGLGDRVRPHRPEHIAVALDHGHDGPQPSACAACIFVFTGPSIKAERLHSLMAFQILVMREPPAQARRCAAAPGHGPSCSTIS